MRLLQELVGERPLWPAIKANAYGHGAVIVARHLVETGYDTLCVAHTPEAVELREAGVNARLLLLSATLPEHAEAIVAHGLEPVVCTVEMLDALSREAERAGRELLLHLKVDTGMGRIGIRPDEVSGMLDRCDALPALGVRGLMSHFPRADEQDKSFSLDQLEAFRALMNEVAGRGIRVFHMANSAAVFDLPGSHLDAARPGISIYGLRPSEGIANPRVRELLPVLEWKTRLTFLKEVPEGTGLSYGHTFRAERPLLVATLPVGYGDGLSRRLSNDHEVLVHGVRCRQLGRITMDQSQVDVSALRGQVALGDEVVLIGRQGSEEVTADELAKKIGTINYEIVTAISARVPRVAVSSGGETA